MKDMILYFRQVVATWMIDAFFVIAPKRMKLIYARYIMVAAHDYADFLKLEMERQESE